MRQDFTNAEYPTIADFIEAVDLPPLNPANKWHYDAFMGSAYSEGGRFYGADCHTGEAVKKTMLDGWSQGRERLSELSTKLDTADLRPVDKRRRLTRGPSGDSLDIHAVYSGRLDVAWRSARRTSLTGPQKIELCANMLCSGAEHADVLFWRGAAAVVLADLLERAGYMVRLAVVFGGNAYGERTPGQKTKTSCRVIVKDHGAPLDITSTSAVLLPGFFRALGHAWIANHCPYARQNAGISVEQGVVEPQEILLSHSIRDHGTALAFVNNTIGKLNQQAQGAAA